MRKRIQRVISIGLVSLLCFFALPQSGLSVLAAEIVMNTVDISTQTDESYSLLGSGAAVLNVLAGGVLNGSVDMNYMQGLEAKYTVSVAEGAIVNGDVISSVEIADETTFSHDTSRLNIANSGTVNGTVQVCQSANLTNSGTIETLISDGLVTLNGGIVRTMQIDGGHVVVSGETTVAAFKSGEDIEVSGEAALHVTDSLTLNSPASEAVFKVDKTTVLTTKETFNVLLNATSYSIPAGTTGKTLVDLYGTAPARTVTMGDFYYGETAPSPKLSQEGASLQYKKKGAQDSAYSASVPTKTGEYIVRATFPATDLYGETYATDEFTISYMTVPANPVNFSGEKGNHGIYTSDVTLTAKDGYLLCETKTGSFAETITYSSSQENLYVYVKKESTGATSDKYQISDFEIDKTFPKMTGAKSGNTYYTDKELAVTIRDDNLYFVKVNSSEKEVTGTKKTLSLTADGKRSCYKIVAKDKAGNQKKFVIYVAPAWMENGKVPTGTKVSLVRGTAYQFESGNWKVNGDATSYSGGQKFYVSANGDYQFTKE